MRPFLSGIFGRLSGKNGKDDESAVQDAETQLRGAAARAMVENDATIAEEDVERMVDGAPPSEVTTMAARVYEKGDVALAKRLYDVAAKAGEASAMYSLGRIHMENTSIGDRRSGIKLLARAAKNGHGWAQYAVAQIFYNGEDGIVERDLEEALVLYKLADKNGIPPAAYNIGNMLYKGEGVETPDKEAAAEFYRKAVTFGDPKAKTTLAKMHSAGIGGVERDEKKPCG